MVAQGAIDVRWGEGKSVLPDPTEELHSHNSLRKWMLFLMERWQNTQCIAASCLWGRTGPWSKGRSGLVRWSLFSMTSCQLGVSVAITRRRDGTGLYNGKTPSLWQDGALGYVLQGFLGSCSLWGFYFVNYTYLHIVADQVHPLMETAF